MLFTGKADCTMCHRGPHFADDQFHALGISGADEGRFKVTGAEADRSAVSPLGARRLALNNGAADAVRRFGRSPRRLWSVLRGFDVRRGRPKSEFG